MPSSSSRVYYCPTCYRVDNPGRVPSANSSRRIECLNPARHFPTSRATSQALPMRSTPTSRAAAMAEIEVFDLDQHLEDWANAGGSEREKSNRDTLVKGLNQIGIDYEKDTIVVNGPLSIDLPALKTLPDNLHIKGDLSLTNCTDFEKIPKNIKVDGDLKINFNDKLKDIPKDMNVAGKVTFSHCRRFETIPNKYTFNGPLFVLKCNNLKELPEKMTVKGYCSIIECMQLTHLSKKELTVEGDLHTMDCLRLANFPEKMNIGGDINLENCRAIQVFPESIKKLGPVPEGKQLFARQVNIKGTNIPFREEQRLVNNPPYGLKLLVGISDRKVDATVVMSDGEEFDTILAHLDRFPKDDIFIQYKDHKGQVVKGIDAGGLSRQAFSRAVQQMLECPEGLFVKEKGKYRIKDIDTAKDDISSILGKSRDAGRIIARLPRIHTAIGPNVVDSFYKRLHEAVKFVDQLPQDVRVREVLDKLVDVDKKGTDLKEVVKLLGQINPSELGTAKYQEYMDTLDGEDLLEQSIPAAMYVNMATAYFNQNPSMPAALKDFQSLLAGAPDCREELAKSLKVTTSKENEKLAVKLNQWMKKAVRDASVEHVAKVSEDLTGSRYVSTDAPYIDVRFSKLPGYELLFDAHSCTLELDVDLDFFKKLAKEDNFKAFERAFINASASTFYQA